MIRPGALIPALEAGMIFGAGGTLARTFEARLAAAGVHRWTAADYARQSLAAAQLQASLPAVRQKDAQRSRPKDHAPGADDPDPSNPRRRWALKTVTAMTAGRTNASRTCILHGHIGATPPFSADAAAAFFADMLPCQPVTLEINSDGGWVETAFEIARHILAHGGPVTARIRQKCDSAALIVAAACDRRIASSGATFHFHRVAVDGRMTAQQMRSILGLIESDDQRMVRFLARACGIGEQQIDSLCRGQSTVTAARAKALGLIHDVR